VRKEWKSTPGNLREGACRERGEKLLWPRFSSLPSFHPIRHCFITANINMFLSTAKTKKMPIWEMGDRYCLQLVIRGKQPQRNRKGSKMRVFHTQPSDFGEKCFVLENNCIIPGHPGTPPISFSLLPIRILTTPKTCFDHQRALPSIRYIAFILISRNLRARSGPDIVL
jgi:hypothetical protein